VFRQTAIRFWTRFFTPAKWWWSLGLMMVTPALVLAWLGLRVVSAERIEQEERLRQQRVQLTHLTDAAIAAVIDRLESDLRHVDTDSQDVNFRDMTSDLVLLTFEKRGLLSFHHEKVFIADAIGPLGSELVPAGLPPRVEQLVEQAQTAEAQRRRNQALSVYRRIRDTEPQLSDWARLSIARVQYEAGDITALAALTDLAWAESNGLTPTALPVALLACAYAESLPLDQLSEFVPVIERALDRLSAGSWWLRYDERLFYEDMLTSLLKRAGGEGRHLNKDQDLEEVAAITRMTRDSPPSRRDDITRFFAREQIGSFLVLWLPSKRGSDVWLGVAASERRLASLLDGALLPLMADQPFAASVRDTYGTVIWRSPGDNLHLTHVEALHSLTGWEIAFGDPRPSLINQKLMLWYGLIIVLIMMLITGLLLTMRVMRREAELAQMQYDFVAAVSHDFKSPITGIRLLMERISRGRVRGATTLNEYYVAIEHETRRLERHVNRLLEVQQIQEGRRQYVFISASISQIVKRVINELRPQAQTKQIGIEIEDECDIAELPIDEAAISEAIENLIDNAVRYSPDKSNVRVAVHRASGEVCVEISDQGIGIERDDLPRIFDRFFRGRRAAQQATTTRGTGLGLTLVKAIAEAHGGRVVVVSEPGKGSCFSLRLPITDRIPHGAHSDN
jgi:two-component system phosphate regulon sensor histidine kinase PhoR